MCLFKKYEGGSRNGLIVLCQSSEFQDEGMGSGYTIKEYHSRKTVTESGWEHESIILKPLSNDPTYEDILLDSDRLENFKVIGVFMQVLDGSI